MTLSRLLTPLVASSLLLLAGCNDSSTDVPFSTNPGITGCTPEAASFVYATESSDRVRGYRLPASGSISASQDPDFTIDMSTDTVPSTSLYSLEYVAKGDMLLVPAYDDGIVYVVDGVSSKATATLSEGRKFELGTSIYDLAVDSTRDRAYVTTDDGFIAVSSVSTQSGTVTTKVTIPYTDDVPGDSDARLAVNCSSDVLYISFPDGVIQRYDNASQLTADSLPSATMTVADVGYFWGLALDAAKDILYVADQGNGTISRIEGISTKTSGALTPVIFQTTNSEPGDIAVDGSNRLYVAETSGELPGLLIYDNASTLSGTVAESRSIDTTLNYSAGIAIR